MFERELLYNISMTAREKRISENIRRWRAMTESERRILMHAANVQHAANSMAMEGEPVSEKWLKANAR